MNPATCRNAALRAESIGFFENPGSLSRMGHSSIQVTFDTYGHLFPATDEGQALAEAESRLLAMNAT